MVVVGRKILPMMGKMTQTQKIKARESGQTREGKGAMAVRLLRCHAFTDAPNTSVVLWLPGEGDQGGWMGSRRWRRKVEEEGESGAVLEASGGGG